MVFATQRHRELVADLASQRFRLGEFQMMGIAGRSLADEAWLCGDENEMRLVSSADWFFHWGNYLNVSRERSRGLPSIARGCMICSSRCNNRRN